MFVNKAWIFSYDLKIYKISEVHVQLRACLSKNMQNLKNRPGGYIEFFISLCIFKIYGFAGSKKYILKFPHLFLFLVTIHFYV